MSGCMRFAAREHMPMPSCNHSIWQHVRGIVRYLTACEHMPMPSCSHSTFRSLCFRGVTAHAILQSQHIQVIVLPRCHSTCHPAVTAHSGHCVSKVSQHMPSCSHSTFRSLCFQGVTAHAILQSQQIQVIVFPRCSCLQHSIGQGMHLCSAA